MRKLSVILALLFSLSSLFAQTAGEGIDVTHYEIYVWDFDFANRTLQGEAFVNFTTTAEISSVVLELKSLTVTAVTGNYEIESFSQDGDLLTIVFDGPVPFGVVATLDIRYGGNTFSETWGGVEWWGSDRVYNLGVGFDSQPHNLGKTWFPCVDNFTDKATYDVYITATNDKKAICGGNHIETIDNGDGTSTWYWSTQQEISTYHISFAVGNYELYEDVYEGIERDIPIEIYALPSQMNSVPGTFVHIKEIARFFEENLGPYPFNRIGYVSTSKGCMEHTDNIAFASSIIDGTTSGEEYVAHELSHMWSGNLVTCSTAGDMWLNEGFAQFWGAFYEVGVYGEQQFQNTISTMVGTITSWCSNPIHWMPLNNMSLDSTYDSKAVYDRGAVIVNTMMNYMGRENFLPAMKQYFQQYAYQAASSEDLCEALTQYSGIDMHGFFDTYVYSAGMPHLYASIQSVEPVGDQFEVTLDLRYQHVGSSHVGQNNAYDVTFIGPEFELATQRVNWDGQHGNATVLLDFEPVGLVNDFNNNWLDAKMQKRILMKTTSYQSFENFTAMPNTIGDSTFISIENHLVGPYNDPLIPNLTLSDKHFWTINRHDFGNADIQGLFNYNNEGGLIQSPNDSVTLLYRRNGAEPWHEIEHSFYQGSTWSRGYIVVDDFPSGEYVFAVWDKEALGEEEHLVPEQRMQVFPNPAKGRVNVSWGEAADGQIRIVSTDGKELKSIGFAQTDGIGFSTEDLPKGWCSVVRLDKDGRVLATEKLIIK